MLELLKAIFTNGAVWGALIVLADTLVDEFATAFPPTVWNAIVGLTIAVLGSIGVIVEARKAIKARNEAAYIEVE